ncbi:DUF308 domain-containing protein [Bdellovibrio sp. HCB290]|uniref:DUF308 domain-containing protein n=1 Tax=Bdellovibrio sp. HCB290 TaxID=3394356 RepID=UPI0039B5D7F9
MHEQNNLIGLVLICLGIALVLVFFVLRKRLPKWMVLSGISVGVVLVGLMLNSFINEQELIRKNRELLASFNSHSNRTTNFKGGDEKPKEWKACTQDSDCKIVEGACSDIIAINKGYSYPATEKTFVEQSSACWPRDYKNSDVYEAVCSKETCAHQFNQKNPVGFYRAWHRNVEESLKIPAVGDRNSELRYFVEFKLNPYLVAIGDVQRNHPNLAAVRDLFKAYLHGTTVDFELRAFALGETYIANTKDFEMVFKENSADNHYLLCEGLNWGLLNSKTVSAEKRLSVIEKLCGSLLEEPIPRGEYWE